MIKAIVYFSETGFTKKYAEALSQMTGLQAYALRDAIGLFDGETETIFMGWILNDIIQGRLKAKRLFNVKMVIGVGISRITDDQRDKLSKVNNVDKNDLFYLRGGYRPQEIRESLKSLMEMEAAVVAQIKDKSDAQNEMLDIVKNGADFINEDYLSAVLERLYYLENA